MKEKPSAAKDFYVRPNVRGSKKKYGSREIKIARTPPPRANNKEYKPHVSYYISPVRISPGMPFCRRRALISFFFSPPLYSRRPFLPDVRTRTYDVPSRFFIRSQPLRHTRIIIYRNNTRKFPPRAVVHAKRVRAANRIQR